MNQRMAMTCKKCNKKYFQEMESKLLKKNIVLNSMCIKQCGSNEPVLKMGGVVYTANTVDELISQLD